MYTFYRKNANICSGARDVSRSEYIFATIKSVLLFFIKDNRKIDDIDIWEIKDPKKNAGPILFSYVTIVKIIPESEYMSTYKKLINLC